MIETFKRYFTKLEQLSRYELVQSAEKLVLVENTTIAKLIAHLAEMSARKTALELGYKSLYDYCIKHLNLSEGAVPARIHVANVSRRFPQLLVALSESRVSLTVAALLAPHLKTVAALLAPHLKEDNVDELISDCAGKTRRETEEYLVAIKPKPVFEPSIRKRPSQPALVEPPREASAPSPPPAVETPKNSPPILQPARPEIYNFRFSANRDFKDKFERLAEVVGIENAQKHIAEIMEKALDIALEKKDPKKKLERRRKRQRGAEAPSRSNEMGKKDEPAQSRYVASEVSERVHERGSYQCVFLGPDGTRCTARARLQIDHAARSGSFTATTSPFFRFCAQHTIDYSPNVFTGRRSSSARLMKDETESLGRHDLSQWYRVSRTS